MTVEVYGPVNATAAQGEDGVFTATLTWHVKYPVGPSYTWPQLLPDLIVGPLIASGQLPRRGSRYGNTLATCRSVSAARGDQNGVVIYTANYSDKNADSEKQEEPTNENPLFDRPIITWKASIESKAIYKDRDDKPILNSAGDPVIDTRDENPLGASVKSNVAFLPEWVLTYRNATNDAEFSLGGLVIAANVARITFPSGFISEPKDRNGIKYYEFTYDLEFDEQDKHYGTPINAGFREKVDKFFGDGVNDFMRNITNTDGTEVSDVVPLDENGRKIDLPTPENTLVIEVKKYYEKDFSILPGVVT